ncbi:hypothetical protein BDR06DRAFT_360692 [Suillus hirtellus]|nr:hypothetical protein BDR06DRAFT_360692 [Suillus hirtellus]
MFALGSRGLRKCWFESPAKVRIPCSVLVFFHSFTVLRRRSAMGVSPSLFGPSNGPIHLHFPQILYYSCRTLLGGRCCALLCIAQKTSMVGNNE